MNKNGQANFIFILCIGVVFLLLGLALSPALSQVVDEKRAELNCSTTVDNQTKAVCTAMDLQKLYPMIIFGLAGMLLGWVMVR